jgi:hypothetical protein
MRPAPVPRGPRPLALLAAAAALLLAAAPPARAWDGPKVGGAVGQLGATVSDATKGAGATISDQGKQAIQVGAREGGGRPWPLGVGGRVLGPGSPPKEASSRPRRARATAIQGAPAGRARGLRRPLGRRPHHHHGDPASPRARPARTPATPPPSSRAACAPRPTPSGAASASSARCACPTWVSAPSPRTPLLAASITGVCQALQAQPLSEAAPRPKPRTPSPPPPAAPARAPGVSVSSTDMGRALQSLSDLADRASPESLQKAAAFWDVRVWPGARRARGGGGGEGAVRGEGFVGPRSQHDPAPRRLAQPSPLRASHPPRPHAPHPGSACPTATASTASPRRSSPSACEPPRGPPAGGLRWCRGPGDLPARGPAPVSSAAPGLRVLQPNPTPLAPPLAAATSKA